jgi:hypothetical protein
VPKLTGEPFPKPLARLVRTTRSQHRQAAKTDARRLSDAGLRSMRDLRRAVQAADLDADVRRLSSWAIGRLRPSGWIHVLGTVVRMDPHPSVVQSAAQQLVMHDSNAVRRVFRDALSAGKHSVNRAAGAWALGSLNVESATPLLVEVASRSDEATEVRAEAVEALGYMRQSSPVEVLIGLLDDPAGPVRCEAAFSLGNLGDARALPFLVRLAKDSTPCGQLGRLGEVATRAARTIRMLLRVDAKKRVRRPAATNVIGRSRRRRANNVP